MKKQTLRNLVKKVSVSMAAMMLVTMCAAGCGSQKTNETVKSTETSVETEAPQESVETTQTADIFEDTTITVFAAKSLNTVLDDLIGKYNETQPNVKILPSYDSSGTLMEQIRSGSNCDVFFSAAQKQMNQLEEEDYLVDGTRANVVNNQVCVVTYKGSSTKVTGLDNLGDAASFALADGSVPVGKYTRQALVNADILEKVDDVSQITTQEVSDALGGVEINECSNVGAVTSAVAEGANEVGTVYYSDTYGLEDKLDILEKVSYDLTGDVIYPVAQIENEEADELQQAAALDFVKFLTSDEAKAVFDSYYFDTDVQ